MWPKEAASLAALPAQHAQIQPRSPCVAACLHVGVQSPGLHSSCAMGLDGEQPCASPRVHPRCSSCTPELTDFATCATQAAPSFHAATFCAASRGRLRTQTTADRHAAGRSGPATRGGERRRMRTVQQVCVGTAPPVYRELLFCCAGAALTRRCVQTALGRLVRFQASRSALPRLLPAPAGGCTTARRSSSTCSRCAARSPRSAWPTRSADRARYTATNVLTLCLMQLANRLNAQGGLAAVEHLRSVRDVFPILLTAESDAEGGAVAAEQRPEAAWRCPVSGALAGRGGVSFSALRPCGHVIASRILAHVRAIVLQSSPWIMRLLMRGASPAQIPEKVCVCCSKAFTDAVLLKPPPQDAERAAGGDAPAKKRRRRGAPPANEG